MALNKEVWVNQIKDNFYPDSSFLTHVSNFSELVDNDKLHIPSTGIDPKVLINNTTYPIKVLQREDDDNIIVLDKFETENTLVRRPEAIEYSYNKLESVISQHRSTLQKAVAIKAAHTYAPTTDTADTPVITTSGEAYNGRKRLCMNDILSLKERFDDAQIPLEKRYIILQSKHVSDLLREDVKLFKEITDIREGQPFKFAGFGFYAFPTMPTYRTVDSKLTKVAYDDEAQTGDMFASVAFQADEVMKADDEIYMYATIDDPKERGSIVGFDKRFVALPIRGKGVGAIVSAKA